MSKTFDGTIKFPSNFNVQGTYPLDDRLVVDSIEDLTNGSIESPYQGMNVTIKGTSEIWILKTQGIEASHNINNWAKVTGSGGSGIGEFTGYTVPVMTPKMVEDATADSDIDFDGSEDPYILLDYDAESLGGETTTNTITSLNGTYLDIMMRAIRSLQAEVARLKNSFTYGIDSYKDTKTAKSVLLGEYNDVSTDEPLWAIDPGYLSLVPDNTSFNTYLDQNHSFVRLGDGTIDVSVEGQLTFNNCKGKFSDGDSDGNNLTLYNLKDSKLITYLITDKPTITMNLVSMDNKTLTREVNFEPLLRGNTVNKYGFCVVISRKVEDSKTGTKKGFNYIYFSILNYETDKKLYEGYLTSDGELSSTKVGVGERYTIESLIFDKLTLSRMRFYTKFEDFSDEVISSAPSESDYKYEVAHITIRSVENAVMLESIKDQLKDNELIWNKGAKTLHIKSNDKICLIGSNNKEDDNKDTNMTNKQIIEALEKMGLIINVEYEGDTDVIKSVTNMSLAPISDFTFVNGDTGKKFTFTVDNEGNLVGKDKSVETIDEFMARIGDNAGDYDESNYTAVRGFICDYLNRIGGNYDKSKGVNATSDAGKKSDRLRFSSFYAPITTDTAHGCTHSFVELENTSNVDIPLDGIYLHFYNPAAEKVYHLELDGVIKAGGTYLIRGAKHAEFEDESAFIKVKTFDKEWYDNGKLLSFEQVPVKTVKVGSNEDIASDSPIKCAYRFCLTYGLPNLKETDKLVDRSTADLVIGNTTYKASDYPNKIINPRFIDSCSYSTFASVSNQTGEINPETGKGNPWYANGDTAGIGITITANSMFRLMFALDPAKQAYNGFNAKDSSRIRYNKASDIQILNLDKEFIGYPKSNETIKIDRYTPKASFENRNVMTDKSQLDSEKPNMVTCSFGVDVYNTRCFNWISCGTFDEYIWLRKQGETSWTKFQSYTKVSDAVAEGTGIHRKEYSKLVNNAVYARMINRFPGNNVLFTSHKCVIVLPDVTIPTVYEYVVGRPDKDGNPDVNHTNEKYTFTLYPRTYEGRVYQITDQQGFNWIEYQVWSASAEFLNTEIATECSSINAKESGTKVFPILINTGDMTQSGARINEWLDYYNGGKSLFNHLEQMNCVGNNDLNPVSPNDLGTGNDSDKSVSHFFHYFYCFDLKDSERYSSVDDNNKKFFSGETLVVPAHSGEVLINDVTTNINITEDKYIPSFYYFKTNKVMYIMVNSEVPEAGVQKWFGLCSSNKKYVNIYTGIETISNGKYDKNTCNFTPLYETMYAWMKDNNDMSNDNKKKVVVAMHEMPFTVITKASLDNAKSAQLKCTRNHPTNGSRVGSNTNQLNIDENRGIYWCSRLLEYFGCKLVIGGHKHTYALSYPIKERYTWVNKNETETPVHYSNTKSNGKYDIKPMYSTLADEAGENPDYNISWNIGLSTETEEGTANRTEFNISTVVTAVPNDATLNTTKTPYIPESMYNEYGKLTYSSQNSGIFRCCTPINVEDSNYDGFINYSMCQATGYKLKSNKELPSQLQVFSKIIPMTTHASSGDSPSGEQLYPMYSVLEFNNDCSEVDVKMMRIQNIFKANGKDKFDQLNYGTKKMANQSLCTYEKEDCNKTASSLEEANTILNQDTTKADTTLFRTDEGKIYKCVVTDSVKSWKELSERMYGKWLDKAVANTRLNNYLNDPTNVSDNRYLHIKF